MMLIIHFTIRQEVSPVCLSFHLSVLCRSCAAHRLVGSIQKILLMLSYIRVSGITQGNKSKSSTYQSMH